MGEGWRASPTRRRCWRWRCAALWRQRRFRQQRSWGGVAAGTPIGFGYGIVEQLAGHACPEFPRLFAAQFRMARVGAHPFPVAGEDIGMGLLLLADTVSHVAVSAVRRCPPLRFP